MSSVLENGDADVHARRTVKSSVHVHVEGTQGRGAGAGERQAAQRPLVGGVVEKWRNRRTSREAYRSKSAPASNKKQKRHRFPTYLSGKYNTVHPPHSLPSLPHQTLPKSTQTQQTLPTSSPPRFLHIPALASFPTNTFPCANLSIPSSPSQNLPNSSLNSFALNIIPNPNRLYSFSVCKVVKLPSKPTKPHATGAGFESCEVESSWSLGKMARFGRRASVKSCLAISVRERTRGKCSGDNFPQRRLGGRGFAGGRVARGKTKV
jgi:hypothetical protein